MVSKSVVLTLNTLSGTSIQPPPPPSRRTGSATNWVLPQRSSCLANDTIPQLYVTCNLLACIKFNSIDQVVYLHLWSR